MSEYPARKPMRLKNYDYSAPGVYFITVCTGDKRCILSGISNAPEMDAASDILKMGAGDGVAPPVINLTEIGKLVEEQIQALPARIPGLVIERYVIMPNHIHLLIKLTDTESGGASPSPTGRMGIVDAVRILKSQTTRLSGTSHLWQRSFYDHIVRNQTEYNDIAEYIDANPARWLDDRFFPKYTELKM